MKKPDFSGWATKTGLECSDGRTIMDGAFSHQDGEQVPLVWAHSHDEPTSVLGHAILEKRAEGIYCHGYLNKSDAANHIRHALQNKDLNALSIFANKLRESGRQVIHGFIKEVSLVLAGANPEAIIENVSFAHGDGIVESVDEVIITMGAYIEHGDLGLGSSTEDESVVEHAGEKTVGDIYNTMNDEQKTVVNFMIGAALEEAGVVKHSDEGEPSASAAAEEGQPAEGEELSEEEKKKRAEAEAGAEGTEGTQPEGTPQTDTSTEGTPPEGTQSNKPEGDLAHQEGSSTMNVFDQNAVNADDRKHALTHDGLVKIVRNAKAGMGFKDAVLAHAEEYGITDINLLFPDAKALETTPQFISRRMEWVATVLAGTKHSPFAKVKTLLADITADEARAKGYITGRRKKEEVFGLLKRSTGPTTIYKKQKLDRDDLLDITDIDVVNWLKAEMRLMVEEELARCILVGDNRSNGDDDKVQDPAGATHGDGIRSILHDDDLYAMKHELAANVLPKDAVKGVIRAMDGYRGSGTPTMFISRSNLTEMLLDEDRFGRPLYADRGALADKLGVDKIVTVDLFSEYEGLFAIIVSLQDYTVGSNRGGELTSFEDFDIDFNQHKYLQETRLSGGLTKPFSALVVRRLTGTLATAQAPSFDGTTNTIDVPVVDGVSYYNAETDVELTGDVVITQETVVEARADEGRYLATGTTRQWTYAP